MSHRTEGESASVHGHRHAAPRAIPTRVLTVSDTRTPGTDTGGALVAELLEAAGHPVQGRLIVPDEIAAITRAVEDACAAPGIAAVILTGGTGIAPRDVTPEAVRPLLERELTGFGELFRMLSYGEIGSAAMLSRALAGLRAGRVVLAIPGSRGAIRLAMEKLILPELGHLVAEAGKTP